MVGRSEEDGDRGRGQEGGPLLDRGALERSVGAAGDGGPGTRRGAQEALLERAALEVAGEVGYPAMTVTALLERSGSNRDRLYRAFGGTAECYLAAYRTGIDELVARVLAAGAEAPDWPAGMRRALEELAGFLEAEPLLARGLIAEPWAAGGDALAKRSQVFERLSRAIDRARREVPGPRHAPPPITASFILSGIEAEVLRIFRSRRGSAESLVEAMLYLAVLLYLGPEAARAEVARVGRA